VKKSASPRDDEDKDVEEGRSSSRGRGAGVAQKQAPMIEMQGFGRVEMAILQVRVQSYQRISPRVYVCVSCPISAVLGVAVSTTFTFICAELVDSTLF
jgi:hypothetical protein